MFPLRINLPIPVTRLSSAVVHTVSDAFFACTVMLLNLYISNSTLLAPTRFCLKKTGPGDVNLIRRMINRKKGERISSTIREKQMSKVRLTILFLRRLRGSVRIPMSGISPSLSRTARLRIIRKKSGTMRTRIPSWSHLFTISTIIVSSRKGRAMMTSSTAAGAYDLGKPVQFPEIKSFGQGVMIVVGQHPVEPVPQVPGPHNLIQGLFRHPAAPKQEHMLLLVPFTDKMSGAHQ